MTPQDTPNTRQLRRRSHDRILGGVCGGFADYAGLDASMVRIVMVVLTLVFGAAVPVYLAALLLIPEEGQPRSIAENLLNR